MQFVKVTKILHWQWYIIWLWMYMYANTAMDYYYND